MVRIMGKFGLKVVVNRMENSKGNGKTVKPLGRSKALNASQDLLQPMHFTELERKVKLPMKVLYCYQVQLDCFIGHCVG